jgi:hypothetical protein
MLESVPAAAAVRDLLALTFHLPTAVSRAACFARVADLAALVPTFNLHRQLRIESLAEVVTLVERHLTAAD